MCPKASALKLSLRESKEGHTVPWQIASSLQLGLERAVSRWVVKARRLVALAAVVALALQLVLPTPRPAAAAVANSGLCHSEPAVSHHGGKHDVPSGKAGCDWCVLCGKLGTAVGPLDRVAGLPQRSEAPVAVIAAILDLGHGAIRARTGPVGARAPPDIA